MNVAIRQWRMIGGVVLLAGVGMTLPLNVAFGEKPAEVPTSASYQLPT